MEKERKRIIAYYALFFIFFFAAFAPTISVSLAGMIVLIFILIALYTARSKAVEDSLTENHLSFLIKTFWKANLFLVIFSSIGAIYFVLMMDFEASAFCMDHIQNHAMTLANSSDLNVIRKILKPCEDVFIDRNKDAMIQTALILFVPISAYLIYRLIYGMLKLKNLSYVPKRIF